MHSINHIRLIVYITILTFINLNGVQAQSGNLLTNPGFEAPFISINATPDGQSIANGWNAWNVPRSDDAPNFENLAPEYYEAVREDRIFEGGNAQRYESFFATHDGGVFQVVTDVGADREVTFSAQVYVWSSGIADDEDVSAEDGDVLVQVGIDPTGGTDGTSGDIIWSQARENYDEYSLYEVSAITESDTISVWVRSRVGFPVNTSRIYVDAASLTREGDDPTEAPTDDPTEPPTDDPTEPPTDAPTDEPTQPPNVDPTPTPDGGSGVTPPPTATGNTGGTGGPAGGGSTTTGGGTGDGAIGDDFPSSIIYTVQPGDSVTRIATRYNSGVTAIRSANGLDTNALIFIGQRLVVPVPAAVVTATPNVIVVTATPVTGTGGGTGGPANVYVVQPGDTLSAIARRYNTTVATLAQLNGIVNANSIQVGQRLVVTGATGGPVVPTAQPNVSPTATPVPQVYVVQPGDNLYRISLRLNVSLADLIRVNNIADANRIFVGQRLVLP